MSLEGMIRNFLAEAPNADIITRAVMELFKIKPRIVKIHMTVTLESGSTGECTVYRDGYSP